MVILDCSGLIATNSAVKWSQERERRRIFLRQKFLSDTHFFVNGNSCVHVHRETFANSDLEPRSLTSLLGRLRLEPMMFVVVLNNNTIIKVKSTMMKLALLTTLLAGSASAFAPSSTTTKTTTTALNGAFDNEIGAASAELGCWDPLGYVSNGDQKRFDHLRGVELKHGRIAMLATWGYATTWSGARFPGCENFPAGHEVCLETS